MSIKVIVNVDNPEDVLTGYGAVAKVRLERDTSSAFSTAVEIATQTVVAGTSQYEFWDDAGSPSSWYRSRLSNSAGTEFSEYSDGFQAGAPQAYATIDALRELLQLPDASRDNLLADLLRRVTVKINTSLGFDVFRHPAVSGTEVRTYDVNRFGDQYLHIVDGILSLTLVETAPYTGGTYSTVAVTDYALRSKVSADGPYVRLQLIGATATGRLYEGYDTVRLTGVFGYPAVPADIEQATLHWAADLYRVGATGGVAAIGVGLEDFGQPRFAGGMPRIAYETVTEYRERHHGVLVR